MARRRITQHQLAQAAQLYDAFTGEPASVLGRIELPMERVLTVVGVVEAIAYNATRDGERASYQHEFAPAARPLLAVSINGRRLHLVGGSFIFGERGIEDVV